MIRKASDQPLRMFSNGDDLVLVLNDQIYVAERSYIKNVNISQGVDLIDFSRPWDYFRKSVPGLRYANIDLSLTSCGLEHFPEGKVDIDQFLFKNATILKMLKTIRSKAEERDDGK